MDAGARIVRACGAGVLACVWVALAAPAASAAPPPNDNYLSSLQMVDGNRVARQFTEVVNTAEATVQADLFNPSRDGLPLAGGGPEPTSCAGASYGHTVWYDFLPEISGGAEIMASGYDTVVAVYEYDVETARIVRRVACENRGAGEDVLLPTVRGGRAYTIQVGGVGEAAGALDFTFLFFGDRDRDGVLDEAPDECPRMRGISAAGGCPPELNAAVSLTWDVTAGGLRFTSMLVRDAPRGARVEARCRRCGVRRAVARSRGGIVRLGRLVGRTAPPRAALEVFVTQRARGSGRFRHGAIGTYIKYVFDADGIRTRTTRCLRPGSMRPRRSCT
jgi:hypothetical protein